MWAELITRNPSGDCSLSADLTTLLGRVNAGNVEAFATLVESLYSEFKHLAAAKMRGQFNQPVGSLTVSATVVVNDAIMQLRRQHAEWSNRDQFFAVGTMLIRRIVLQYQRERLAQKRGGGYRGISLDDTGAPELPANAPPDATDRLEAIAALDELHAQYPRKAEVVTLHVLCGHSIPKTAGMIGISVATAERDLKFSLAWLRDRLGRSFGGNDRAE